MPARASWKGFLQIRQLQFPVKAFSACATGPEIPLNQLHAGCGQRIRQLKVCPVHGEVVSEEIVSGYQYAEGCYLPLDPQELAALEPEDSKAIAVDCFVDSRAVDPIYHAGRTYYLVPDGPTGQRPFGVLREGLRSGGRYAVSRVVMARRELLVLLRPLGRLIAMTVLEYPHRVRAAADYESEVAAVAPREQERELMAQLIDALTDQDFDLHRYRNAYVDGLTALIQRAIANREGTAAAVNPAEGELADESEFVAALRATLAAAGTDELPLPPRTSALSHVLAEEQERRRERKHA